MEVFDLFGDKVVVCVLVECLEVLLVVGINYVVSVEEVEVFLEGLGDGVVVMFKVFVGGGGCGMCVVEEVV